MTSRERVKAAIAFQRPDCIPVGPYMANHCSVASGYKLKDCYTDGSHLADAQYAQDTAVLAGGKVTSESVGKWSRSIQQDDEQSGSFELRCLRIAAQYIPIRSGLLYRGVSGC